MIYGEGGNDAYTPAEQIAHAGATFMKTWPHNWRELGFDPYYPTRIGAVFDGYLRQVRKGSYDDG